MTVLPYERNFACSFFPSYVLIAGSAQDQRRWCLAPSWVLCGGLLCVCSVQERGLGALEGQQKINQAGRRAPQAPGCPGEEVSRHRVSCEAPRSSWSSAGGAARPEGSGCWEEEVGEGARSHSSRRSSWCLGAASSYVFGKKSEDRISCRGRAC